MKTSAFPLGGKSCLRCSYFRLPLARSSSAGFPTRPHRRRRRVSSTSRLLDLFQKSAFVFGEISSSKMPLLLWKEFPAIFRCLKLFQIDARSANSDWRKARRQNSFFRAVRPYLPNLPPCPDNPSVLDNCKAVRPFFATLPETATRIRVRVERAKRADQQVQKAF